MIKLQQFWFIRCLSLVFCPLSYVSILFLCHSTQWRTWLSNCSSLTWSWFIRCLFLSSVLYQCSVLCQCIIHSYISVLCCVSASSILISVFCVVSVHHPFLYQCSVLCQCIIHSYISVLCCVSASSMEMVEDMVVKLQQSNVDLVHQMPLSCSLSIVLCQYSVLCHCGLHRDSGGHGGQTAAVQCSSGLSDAVVLFSVLCLCSLLCHCSLHRDSGGHGGQTAAVQCSSGLSDAIVLFSLLCLCSLLCHCSLHGDSGGHGGQTAAAQCGPGSSDAFLSPGWRHGQHHRKGQ